MIPQDIFDPDNDFHLTAEQCAFIRKSIGDTRAEFGRRFGVSVFPIRSAETGTDQKSGPLIMCIYLLARDRKIDVPTPEMAKRATFKRKLVPVFDEVAPTTTETEDV
jgi:hypothetical protein